MNQRPPSQVTATSADITLELLALATLVLCIAIALWGGSCLPDTVPTHFNLKGEIDGYGSKYTLLYPVVVSLVLYIGLTILNRYPNAFNYAVEITGENAQIQYRLATRLVRWLKWVVMLTFSGLECFLVMSASGHHLSLAMLLFAPVTLVVVFGSLGYYLYRSTKAQ